MFVKLVGMRDKFESFRVGKNLEDITNAFFQRPMELEFENLLDSFLILSKKRYAAYATENVDKPFELYVKGLEVKRRDNAGFVKGLWNNVLRTLLKEKKPRKALKQANDFLYKILTGQLDDGEFVISQALTRNIEEYASMPPHVAVAAKMQSRNPTNAPEAGDRVQYVITKQKKGSNVRDCAEDPSYAMKNGLEIDYLYYAEKQLIKPLQRLFEPMMRFQLLDREKLLPIEAKSSNVFGQMMASTGRLPMATEKETRSYLFGKTLNDAKRVQEKRKRKAATHMKPDPSLKKNFPHKKTKGSNANTLHGWLSGTASKNQKSIVAFFQT